MGNSIKYTTGSESLALKKGNFYIGTGDVGKGPTSATGYYKATAPPSGGYRIYLYNTNNSGNIAYHTAANDSELISFTNNLAGQSYTTVNECFNYYYSQTDKVCVSQEFPPDYPYIVMDGLVLNLDAGITQSYPGSGTVWTDINGLGSKNNGTLTNGPTFDSGDGGSIVFDGVNDFTSTNRIFLSNGLTFNSWIKTTSSKSVKSYLGDASNNIIGDTGGNVWIGFGVTDGKVNYNNAKKTGNWGTSQYYSTSTVNDGNWKYITVTHNKTNELVNLYINGVLDSTFDNTSSGVYDQWSVTSYNVISRGYGGDYFNGNVSNVQIYNRALSASEVLQNYNTQKGRFGL